MPRQHVRTAIMLGAAAMLAAVSAVRTPAQQIEQAYVGTNQCFICHRQQANAWSETGHAKAFANRYRTDAKCLTCHVTGFDQPQGYVAGTEKDLLMIGCESCHGPGAAHIDAAQRFVMATENEAAIEQEMRESIVKTPSDRVCAGCHTTVAHGSHPPYVDDTLPEPPVSNKVAQNTPTSCRACPTMPTASPARYIPGYSVKTCGSCHYDQYTRWRRETHSALAVALTAENRNNEDCQQCHLAAAGIDVSLIGKSGPASQVGTACEACHGAALEHVRFNVRFIHGPPLAERLERAARQSISKNKPAGTCIQCHVHERHQPHPAHDEQP